MPKPGRKQPSKRDVTSSEDSDSDDTEQFTREFMSRISEPDHEHDENSHKTFLTTGSKKDKGMIQNQTNKSRHKPSSSLKSHNSINEESSDESSDDNSMDDTDATGSVTSGDESNEDFEASDIDDDDLLNDDSDANASDSTFDEDNAGDNPPDADVNDEDSANDDSDDSDSATSDEDSDDLQDAEPDVNDAESSDEDPNITSDSSFKKSTETSSDEDMSIDQKYAKVRKELADLPFSDLQKLKEQIGVKAYNQVMFGHQHNSGKKRSFKRDTKNRPSEMSSKKPVPRFREVIQVKKKMNRDPRFDDLSGEYSERFFKKSYAFIDDIKAGEKQELISQYKKEQNSERKGQMSSLLKRMNQEEKLKKEQDQAKSWKDEWKKKERSLVKDGKQPFYLKKAEMKKMMLAEKFKELKKKKVPTATLR